MKNVLAAGVRDSKNQFRMLFDVQNNPLANLAKIDSLQQWHCRLGHINMATIKNMCDKNFANGISFSDKDEFFCEDCKRGKMHRSSHKVSAKRNAEKCEFIHIDLCGPMSEVGVGGVRYIMLLKDESTNFRYVYFWINLSEVIKKLKCFMPLVCNMIGERVKYIRCDNGTEFINKEVLTFLSYNGITLERITPYTLEQNGFFERDSRTVQESARTMLLASGLQKFLWSEAVKAAVYILNRSTSTTNQSKTPYESWFGTKPDLSHIKVFGTECMVYQPKQTGRKKWDAKAKRMFLVGYEPTNKNFRLYDQDSRKVFISCDVAFNEKPIKIKPLSDENEDEINENDDCNISSFKQQTSSTPI